MEQFSLIVHPLRPEDYVRLFPATKYVPRAIMKRAARFLPPFQISVLKGIRSSCTEMEVAGELRCCPLTTEEFGCLPPALTKHKIISAVKAAEKMGAQIAGLGAWTGVIGERGRAIAGEVGIPVTTGHSLTIYSALAATRAAAQERGLDWPKASLALLGVTGLSDCVGVCARLLARENRFITLAVREYGKVDKAAAEILYETGVAVRVSDHFQEVLRQADVVFSFTAAGDSFAELEPDALKPGAVLCDVLWPRGLGKKVARQRRDVLVIEGGTVSIPGNVEGDWGRDFLPGQCPAWMAEVMVLALAKKFENYSLGYEFNIRQVEEIGRLAKQHGFRPAGFRRIWHGMP
jgi:fatty aldehyde-generating acyl-ACP reductase